MMYVKRFLSSTLIRSSGIYTVSSIINAALPLLLLPYLTRVFSQAEYGIISMFLLLQTFLVPLVSINISSAVSRKYFSAESQTNFAIYVGNAIFLLIVNTLFIGIICFFFHKTLSGITELSLKWIFYAIVVSATQSIFISTLTIYQVRGKAAYYGILQITQTAINLLLTILLIEQGHLGYEGRLYGIVVTYLIFAVVCLIILIFNRDISLNINKHHIKHILSLGIPLIPHVLGGLILGMADRFMIKNIVSIESAGIYTVAYQIGSILMLLTASFNAAYIPWLFKKLKENKESDKIVIVRLTYLYYCALFFTTISMAVILLWILPVLVGIKFYTAKEFVPWILLGLFFNGMYMMVANYIFYAEKTYILAICTISVALLYIPLAYFFIHTNGAVGACQASSISFFLLFILTWFTSNKIIPMPWFKSLKFGKI